MANRHPSFRHVRFTRRSRERHAQADAPPPPAYPVRVQTTVTPPSTGQESLPLAGFYRLYEAQLRAERKSAKTIKIYNEVLGKFKGWFERTYGRQAVLADLITDDESQLQRRLPAETPFRPTRLDGWPTEAVTAQCLPQAV
jgi:hypothetical protein